MALVDQIDYDFTHAGMHSHDQVFTMMRVAEFDRRACDFLARHPRALVVHIGCGLDARFERVCLQQPDSGELAWYDLDLPEVIALRRQLIPVGTQRRYLGCSVFDDAWLAEAGAQAGRPCSWLKASSRTSKGPR